MERVVKFRGKTQDGKWVYGDLIHSGSDEIAILEFDAPCLEAVTDVVPESVGQFTGLHDKNGKEIYEGDVITQLLVFQNGERYDYSTRIGQVVFDKLWCFVMLSKSRLYHLFGDGVTQEVIGNIHDNPNLLNDGRD